MTCKADHRQSQATLYDVPLFTATVTTAGPGRAGVDGSRKSHPPLGNAFIIIFGGFQFA